MYRAVADGSADVITAFSSDGRIAALDLVTLADPRRALPSYDAVLLVSPGHANDPDCSPRSGR
jgi:osmoprotectant transport system permease protein